VPVTELHTAFDDRMPNVAHEGLEVVFSSTWTTNANGTTALGSFDVYVSTRISTNDPWSAHANLGPGASGCPQPGRVLPWT
jgi:hypothetical protein